MIAIAQSIFEVGLINEIKSLPEGMDTRLSASTKAEMSESMKQRLSLARAFAKDAPIYLLDEPGNHLDSQQEEALVDKLNSLKGSHTVIMVSHKTSHLQMADRVLVLERGQVVANGAPEEVLPQLKA
ncbi:hypothetical protein CAPTEDRAFT_117232 [Capitella teleta]|uniref:ABC transporter domain-containing protein n=1 Tax=Capitella teleta TaxID=283909 RepID=R7UEW4_CAPTE|nr:hypothetical protein CAPTEDRAFT_117232 [Capitella teleta]|eukprot:ELU05049.1 hypothetical protein CAPTEDRAFT_117232 [Capitella teleta]